MSTESTVPQSEWTNEQLEVAQQLSLNAHGALTGGNLPYAHQLLLEASAVLDMVEQQNLDSVIELRAQVYNEFGFYYQSTGDLEKAYTYHRQAADLCQELLDRGAAFRPNTTATLINLAGVLINSERLDEAHERILRATELISSFLDDNPDDPDSNHLGFGAYQTRSIVELSQDKLDDAHNSTEVAYKYAQKTFDDLARTLQAASAFQQIALQFFHKELLDYAIHWGKKSEEFARIAFDIEKEPAIPIFVQTQLFLILFHENKGNFDAAEDALYNAIDVLGNHPQLLERGRSFYQQCRKQTDKRLEEGGLPRQEVEEGLKEIESRIEAFGGPEKLAQVITEMERNLQPPQ